MSDRPKSSSSSGNSFTIDETGRVVTCNQACSASLGFESVFDFTGRNLKTFLLAAEGESLADHPIWLCARTGTAAIGQRGVFVRSDNSQFNVSYVVTPVRLERGQQGAVCVFWPANEA